MHRLRRCVGLVGVLLIVVGIGWVGLGQRTILLMVTHSDRDEEYAHVREILETRIPGVVLTELSSDDPRAVEQALLAADAFLIPEQEEAAENQVYELGVAWAQALQGFVNRGGLIIELVGYSANRGVELMRGAGLTSASDVQGYVDVPLEVVDRTHYLSAGVPDTFLGKNGTISFGQYDGHAVVSTTTGEPVVFEKHVGSGSLVAVGFDYYEYNDAMAQVLVNAVGAATEDVYVEERKDAVLDVIHEVLGDVTEGVDLYVSSRPLAAGTTVETWSGDVRTTTDQEWMVFVDDQPEANWGHPARYVFQDIVTGLKTIVSALLPPLDLPVLLTAKVDVDLATGRLDVGFAPPGEGLAVPEGEDVVLSCDGTPIETNIEFTGGRDLYAFQVRMQPGYQLNVSVQDRGMPGDYWQADVYEDGTLVASTRGGGAIEIYSVPAIATIGSGEATVVIQYAGGIDNWPANMGVQMWCGGAWAPAGSASDVDLLCEEEYIEWEIEFGGPYDVWSYDLTVYPGATVEVYVADSGNPGDVWQAEIYNEYGLADWTYGDGSTDTYSYPAIATFPSGRGTIQLSYYSGINQWPASAWVLIECAGGTPTVVPPGTAGPVTPVQPIQPIQPIQPEDTSGGRRVAVLISGGGNKGSNWDRYWNDISFMYRTLKQRYGYADADIHVLYSDGTNSDHDQRIAATDQFSDSPKDLDGDGVGDIDRAATKEDLAALFSELRNELTERDQLYVFVTNHGSQDPEGSDNALLILFYNEYVTDDEFASMANRVGAGRAVYFFEQCFSGGMIEELSRPNHIVITAADWNEPSWACDSEGAYNEMAYHFISALMGQTPTGEAVNADGNRDGTVSIREAFEYARRMDSRSEEHPQYFEGTNGAGDDASL